MSQTATDTALWPNPEKLYSFQFYETKNGWPLGSKVPVAESKIAAYTCFIPVELLEIESQATTNLFFEFILATEGAKDSKFPAERVPSAKVEIRADPPGPVQFPLGIISRFLNSGSMREHSELN